MTSEIPSVNEMLQRAINHRSAGRIEEAEALCRQVLRRESNQVQALHLLALLNKDMGRYSDAVELLSRVIGLDAAHPVYQKDLADAHAALGDVEQAISHYRKALELKNDYFEVHANLAGVLLKTGQIDQALIHDKEAVRLRPENAELQENLGNTLRLAGELASAVLHYKQALRLDPKLVSAYVKLGQAFIELGETADAIESFKHALSLKPKIPSLHFYLAEALSSSHEVEPALFHFRKAIGLDPKQPLFHKGIADTYAAARDTNQAIHHYQEALGLKSDYVEAHADLANVLKNTGRTTKALGHYKEAVRLRPAIAELQDSLGIGFLASGDPESAIACHREAIRLNPELVESHVNLGNALLEAGELDSATESIEQALEIDSDMPEAHYALGNALMERRKFAAALEHYREAKRLRPDFTEAAVGEFTALRKLGLNDAAQKCMEPYRGTHSGDSRIALAISRLAEDDDQRRSSVAYLAYLVDEGISDKRELRRLLFRLGDLYDELGVYNDAFKYYKQANRISAKEFDRVEYRDYIDRLISSFTIQHLRKLPTADNDSELPVFVVGMPRVGKTLVEQILASHPQVYGAGELPDIGNIVQFIEKNTGKPAHLAVDDISSDQLDTLANQYLEQRRLEALPGTTRVIDTMPGNIHYLGLIRMLFPRARIIHCRRDPRDTCLECYLKNFRRSHIYASDLGDLGFRFRCYDRLSRHWHDTLPLLEVYYEELVRDPEAISRQMVNFLELEWDPRCLEFQSAGQARLTSSQEFFHPINDHSVGRWKNYEHHLQPLFAELDKEADISQ